jgi:hypothetical protein
MEVKIRVHIQALWLFLRCLLFCCLYILLNDLKLGFLTIFFCLFLLGLETAWKFCHQAQLKESEDDQGHFGKFLKQMLIFTVLMDQVLLGSCSLALSSGIHERYVGLSVVRQSLLVVLFIVNFILNFYFISVQVSNVVPYNSEGTESREGHYTKV